MNSGICVGLFGAVKALQSALQSQGSNLLVLQGKAADLLPHLVQQYSADYIIAEEEVEYRLGYTIP